MTYRQTLDYLYAQLPMYHRIGAAAYKPNLDNSIQLAKYLGNPEQRFKSIHIAGTNGKGSVSHMIASVFQEAGYKTGLCTSPHLKDFRERFRINGQMIPKRYVSHFVSRHKDRFNSLQPSFFEMTIAMGFCWFAENGVEISVIEAGLGGRLDATNIIKPELSVVTNISLDHTQLLGDTTEKIAFEKAGIIKTKTPVVIGNAEGAVRELFAGRAAQTASPVFFAMDNFKVTSQSAVNKRGTIFSELHAEGYGNCSVLHTPLTATYQLENIATVLQAIQVINNYTGYRLDANSVTQGIENVVLNTGLLGRWQIIGHNPLAICDTGHNPSGIAQVVKNIYNTPHNHLHFVIGVVQDKDVRNILTLLPKKHTTYYFCKPDIPRGYDTALLRGEAKSFGLVGDIYPNVKAAFKAAKKKAHASDLVFVGGSTFVVAEVI